MDNNQEQHIVTHRPETLMRIRQVQEWLICGTPAYTIVQDGMRLWNIQKSMMYDYIAEAHKGFCESGSTERKEDRQLQIQMLMQLYNETMTEKKPGYSFAGLHILKEVAKLKGIYPSRDELLHTEGPVTITLNLDTAIKTGKPENEQGV